MAETILSGLTHLGLVTAFALVALIMWLSTKLSKYLTKGRVHASAIAIVIGLILAYVGGSVTGGQKGITDIALFAGVGLMGGQCCVILQLLRLHLKCKHQKQRKQALLVSSHYF